MPKKIIPLTDAQVKTAKPQDKNVSMFDGGGLYLLVGRKKFDQDGKLLPASKLWRLKYRFRGKEKLLALGAYPAISLADARQRRDDARKLLANDVDPSVAKKAHKAARAEAGANTFESIAREWYLKNKPRWADSHAKWVMGRLEQYVFPVIGADPISELDAPDVLRVLQKIEQVALETAHRVRYTCGQIFRYAVATRRAKRDPTPDLKGALPPRSQKHHPALIDPKEVGGLLRSIDGFRGTFTVRCALRLAPLVFQRPGELRKAEWSEIDFEAGEWNIPIERMKLDTRIKQARRGEKHLVPLSEQAVVILSELHELTGGGRFVFPGARSVKRPMSDMAINAALQQMGYKGEMTAHGFRAMARTIIDEVLDFPPDIIEHQMGHAVKDPNGRAYNRTTKLPQRRKMMQAWADYLDQLRL